MNTRTNTPAEMADKAARLQAEADALINAAQQKAQADAEAAEAARLDYWRERGTAADTAPVHEALDAFRAAVVAADGPAALTAWLTYRHAYATYRAEHALAEQARIDLLIADGKDIRPKHGLALSPSERGAMPGLVLPERDFNADVARQLERIEDDINAATMLNRRADEEAAVAEATSEGQR